MRREIVAKIITMFEVTYPNFYKSLDDDKKAILINVWFDALKNDDEQLAIFTAKAFISYSNSNYPPSPGQFRHVMLERSGNVSPRNIDAWDLVTDFRKIYNYAEQKEHYEELPQEIREVYTLKGIRELNDYDITAIKFEKSRFLTAYNEAKEKAENKRLEKPIVAFRNQNTFKIEHKEEPMQIIQEIDYKNYDVKTDEESEQQIAIPNVMELFKKM